MSTSIIFLDRNVNANDVDIMVFEPSVLSKMPIRLWIKRSKIGKTEKSPKFAQNQLFVTSSIFVPEKF